MVNKSKVDFFFGKFFKMKLLLTWVCVSKKLLRIKKPLTIQKGVKMIIGKILTYMTELKRISRQFPHSTQTDSDL